MESSAENDKCEIIMDISSRSKHFRQKRKSRKLIANGDLCSEKEEKKVFSEVEIPNCSQFIEHEPVVEWGSPQDSPKGMRSGTELITPPHVKIFARKNVANIQKPVRKLIKATESPTQFLTELIGLSEKYKHEAESVSPKSSSDVAHHLPNGASALKKLVTNTEQLSQTSSNTVEKYDYFKMLEDDDDDDIIVQLSQEIEQTIAESKSVYAELPTDKIVVSNTRRISSNGEACGKVSKRVVVKQPSARDSALSDVKQSPLNKTPRVKSSKHSKYYYKDGKLRGCRVGKSPKIKKNILMSLNEKPKSDLFDESFERALQAIVSDESDFNDNLAKNSNDKPDIAKHQLQDNSETTEECSSELKPARFGPFISKYLPRPLQEINTKKTSSECLHKAKPANMSEDLSFKIDMKSKSFALDSTLLEDDVDESELLDVLQTVETQAIQCAPPSQCTPEEIQKKRIEAKRKLAKKKLAAKNKSDKSVTMKPKR